MGKHANILAVFKLMSFEYKLPTGKADKPFYEHSRAEQLKIGQAIFLRAVRQALRIGELPVTYKTRKMTKDERLVIIKKYNGNAKKICAALCKD